MNVCSLFVGNLFHGIDLPSLRNYFMRAGRVRDIYIPKNQKSVQSGKYAFVRFENSVEAMEVAKRCNGDFVWGNNIVVKKAYKERKEAITARIYQQPQPRITYATHWKEKFQISASNASGPGPANVELGNIVYKPNEVDIKWLLGCAVGFLTVSRDINDLQHLLEKQSICCSLRHIGGKMVLLSFLSEDLMREAINANLEWFEEFFDFIKPWEEQDTATTRYVWLQCERIPIHAWNPEFFQMLGNLYGKFEGVDKPTELKERLDWARILVLTPNLEHIKRKHRVSINGKVFEILVSEDTAQKFNPKLDMCFFAKSSQKRQLWTGEPHQQACDDQVRNGEEIKTGRAAEFSNSNSNSNLAAKSFASCLQKADSGVLGQKGGPTLKPATLVTGGNSNSAGPLLKNLGILPISPNIILSSPIPHSPTISILPISPGTHNPAAPLNPPLPRPVESSDSSHIVPNTHLVAVAQSLVSPSIVEAAADHHNDEYVSESELEDYISPEDYLVHETAVARKLEKRAKWISRRKAIDGIGVNSGSGKIPKQATFKYSRKSNIKKKGLPTHEGEDDIGISYGVGNPRQEQSSVGNKGPISIPSSSAKSVKIHKTAASAWKLGQLIGLSHPGGDIGALNLLNGIESKNWDDFEKLQK